MLASSTTIPTTSDNFLTVESEDPQKSFRPINAVKDILAGSSMKVIEDVLGLARCGSALLVLDRDDQNDALFTGSLGSETGSGTYGL